MPNNREFQAEQRRQLTRLFRIKDSAPDNPVILDILKDVEAEMHE